MTVVLKSLLASPSRSHSGHSPVLRDGMFKLQAAVTTDNRYLGVGFVVLHMILRVSSRPLQHLDILHCADGITVDDKRRIA
jgi:hypothetical protein